jgi:tetratricopeptide (TPR) repeat protein
LAYSNRGHAYTDKGDYDRAIADLSNAIRLNPTDAWSYNYRGVAYYSKNNYDKAIADYTEAIRLNSNEAEAYINVARLWAVCPDAKLRNGVKAIEYAKKACELANWKNAYAIDTLAAACAETGNFDEAVKLENKYLKFPLSKEAAIEACQRLSLYEQKKPYHEEKKNYQ